MLRVLWMTIEAHSSRAPAHPMAQQILHVQKLVVLVSSAFPFPLPLPTFAISFCGWPFPFPYSWLFALSFSHPYFFLHSFLHSFSQPFSQSFGGDLFLLSTSRSSRAVCRPLDEPGHPSRSLDPILVSRYCPHYPEVDRSLEKRVPSLPWSGPQLPHPWLLLL